METTMHATPTPTRARFWIALGVVMLMAIAQTALAGTDADARTTVTLSADKDAATGETLCSATTPTLVGSGTSGLYQRRALKVRNWGPSNVVLCYGASSCSLATGFPLQPKEVSPDDVRSTIRVYCLAQGADQVAGSGLRYVEVR
jgi:hypothetical protein